MRPTAVAAPSRPRRALFRLLVVGFFAALTAGGAELTLRLVGVPLYYRYFPGERGGERPPARYAAPHRRFGWVVHGGSPEINPEGFRDAKSFTAVERRPGVSRVLVLGDSFMYGAGVRRQENVPSRLAALLGGGYEVYNLGVPGWGIDQMYLAYREYLASIDPAVVILAFIDADVERTLDGYGPLIGLPKPCLRVEDGRLKRWESTSLTDQLLRNLSGKSLLVNLVLHHWVLERDARPLVHWIVHRIAADAAAAHRTFAVVRIPIPFRRSLLDRVAVARNDFRAAAGPETTYLEAEEALTAAADWQRRYYLEDGHLSAEGSRVVAELLAERVFGVDRDAGSPARQ